MLSRKNSRKPRRKPRPRPAHKPLEPGVVLQSEHSFNLVHTAIAATMFEVIFARKVFPISTKWNRRFYDPTNPDTAYETFVSGTQAAQQGRGLEWHVPTSGQYLVLDKLMDALENGVKDALAKTYLRKIELGFHSLGTGPVSEFNCIESYGLYISYGSNNMPHIDTELRSSQGSQTTNTNVLEGKTNLKEMVNGIARHFLSSEQAKVFKSHPLPDDIRVSLQAEYTTQTPPDYQRLGSIKEIAWKKEETGANEDARYKLTTGFHGVAFICRPPGNRGSTVHGCRQNADTTKSIAPRADECRGIKPSLGSVRVISQRRASHFSVSDGGHTQPEAIQQVKRIHFSRLDHDSWQDTQQYVTGPSPIIPARPSSHTVFTALIPQYTQEIYDFAESKLSGLVSRGHGAPQSVQINCECGASEHDDRLIECLQCHEFHHAECYGYLSNVPVAEFCYTCARDLFSTEEIVYINLEDRKFDCQLRRTIRFFQNGRVAKTPREVATHLGMGTDERSKSVTEQVLEYLAGDGHIVEESTGSFILATGKEPTIPATFFNPRSGIHHIFADNETPPIESTAPSGSIGEPEIFNRRSASGLPRTPSASYPKQYRFLRPMQDSSRRAVSVDDATTQSAFSTPANLQGHGSRERSINSELRTMKLGPGATEKGNVTRYFEPWSPRENSGTKRSAETGRQERSSRRKMK